MRITLRSLIGLPPVLLSAVAFSQPLPLANRSEDVGISSQGLERVHRKMKEDVESGRIPGAVLLLARNGRIASLDAVGFQERRSRIPMASDSILPIASMSKPVTSVAIMVLAEEGKLDIGAPVAQYLPEFKDVRVGVEMAAPKRPMTVHDLLRHTSGLTYGIGDSPVDELYKERNVFASKSLADMIAAIASLPLAHQPGEVWEYSVSTDVLGRIVEVVSGVELDRFVAERITRPLKMPDTGFYVNASQAARLARPDSDTARGGSDPTAKPAVLSGGGGMLSTAGDYARFCQMLLNGGELEGVRILSPKTVALMTSDQIPPAAERHSTVALALENFGPTPENGIGFGLGFAVRTDPGRSPIPGSVGEFGWGGSTGTFFWVDPKEKLVAVLMIRAPQAARIPYWRQTTTLVYQALTN